MRIKLDLNTMRFISMFETMTHASVKDCISGEKRIIFVVQKGEIGKAIGKKGINIKKLENKFKKKIRIIEFNEDVRVFISNVFYPNKAEDITEEEGVVTVVPVDSMTRGYMIGRGAVNLRSVEDIVKRYFDIKEIKVV